MEVRFPYCTVTLQSQSQQPDHDTQSFLLTHFKHNIMENKMIFEEVSLHMQHDVEWLLSLKPEDNRRWQLAKVDLLEMIHTVYQRGEIYDEQGRPASFQWMVTRICRNLHVSIPRNPRSMVSAGRQRKGIRQRCLKERYEWMMTQRRVEQPATEWVS